MADLVFDPDKLVNVIDDAKDAMSANICGESFEEDSVPETWVANRSDALWVSKRHYKHGSQSLCWQWQKGDSIEVMDVYGLADVAKAPRSAFRMWVYNENPLPSQLTLRFGSHDGLREDRYRYQFTFGLNFQGWRGMLVNLNEDVEVNDRGEALEGVMVVAPEDADSGVLFFDIVEFDFERRILGKRSGDMQVPFVNRSDEGHWQQTLKWRLQEPTEPLPDQVLQEEVDAFEIIAQRYDSWMFGEEIDLLQGPMKMRCDALQEYISEGVEAFGKLEIKRADGVVTGVPLFASVSPYGPKITRYAFEKCLIPMVMDYRLNGNADRLQDILDLFDFVHDQGWADGSANESLDHEQNRAGTYMHAVFMMRKELAETGRLARELATMQWSIDMGEIYGEPEKVGTTADRMRSHLLYRLLAVLMMQDDREKLRAMRGLVRWLDNAFLTVPGWAGTFKPDGLGFHHKGIYAGAYSSPAYYGAAQLYHMLHDTPFALSEISRENIRQALLTYRAIANTYEVPTGINGRMPFDHFDLANILAAYAFMALSGEPVDEEMAGVFMRLWKPECEIIQRELICKARVSISYMHTLGSLQMMMDLAAQGYVAEEAPAGHWAKNYGAVSVHRRDEWAVSVKGWSKYVWDYERHTTQNIFGRYISYGAIQIVGSGDPVTQAASGYIEAGWDWSRWPGTTAIYLPLDEVVDLDEDRNRCFSDQPFVGGVSHEGRDGLFAMRLHDTTFDPSFRAHKSVFFFNDLIVCTGSEIENDDRVNVTETTLFQGHLQDVECPIWLNETRVDKFPYDATFSNGGWLLDAYGNGYLVPEGQIVNVTRKRQYSRSNNGRNATENDFATAWIDHGCAPSDASYVYAIVVDATADRMREIAGQYPFEILQQNAQGHIVRHGETVGYVFFIKQDGLDIGALKSVDAPCLIMMREESDHIAMSLCDPDLRLMEEPVPDAGYIRGEMWLYESEMQTVNVHLGGKWDLSGAQDNVRVISHEGDETVLAFDCVDGLTRDVQLRRV